MGTITAGKIYIVHGWAYTLEKWEPILAELKQCGFEPVLLNVPGLTAPIDKPYDIDDYVSWLAGILAQESAPITLLAHSNGGRICLSYTKKYPEKVRNLILIGSAGVYHRGVLISIKRAVFGALAKIAKPLKKISLIRTLVYKIAREKDYRDANETMQKTMSNMISLDVVPFLNEIQCPTLLVWGRGDEETPLCDGEVLHAKIKQSELVVIDEARHSPQFTHVQKVIDAIKTYYAKTNF